jgi:tetratricopeptide (TPR) repeat protein
MVSRSALLEQAIGYLERSLNLSQEYVVARLNLASSLALLGRTEEALEQVEHARRLAIHQSDRRGEADALIIRGVIRYQTGENVSARRDFSDALTHSPRLAKINLALLSGENQLNVSHTPDGGVESIAGVTPVALLRHKRSSGEEFVLRGFDSSRLTIRAFGKDNQSWEGLLVETDDGAIITILKTGPAFAGRTSLGIGKGDRLVDVYRLYGEPNRAFGARQGSYLVYDKPGIIIITDRDETVTGWMIFKRSKQ